MFDTPLLRKGTHMKGEEIISVENGKTLEQNWQKIKRVGKNGKTGEKLKEIFGKTNGNLFQSGTDIIPA